MKKAMIKLVLLIFCATVLLSGSNDRRGVKSVRRGQQFLPGGMAAAVSQAALREHSRT